MMRDALNKTGRHIFFSICEWGLYEPWTWGMKTANSWRVGPDHLPLWWTWETDQVTIFSQEEFSLKFFFKK
jgi:hypothetical protein